MKLFIAYLGCAREPNKQMSNINQEINLSFDKLS